MLSNSGQIDGAVDLLGGSGDTLDNFGLISGNVALAGGDILMNQGQVYGDVTLGSADTYDASSGEVTGAITASSGDLLEFGGNFGAATIDDFAAGTGATHDTIELGVGGLDSYAALTSASAMSQVGSAVMIRLDATDSITLNHVSLSSLVSADFKFG